MRLPIFRQSFHRDLEPDIASSCIRTATSNDIRSWYMSGTPYDYMGGQLGNVEVVGLISFTFNLIIPPAKTIWTKTITRDPDKDFGMLLYATPFKYNMRHRFLLPQYSQG